jgi:hypothetical protein
MKFVEVIGAGAATAVTGYLIAHLSGFWATPAPAPAAMPAAASVSTVSKSARVAPPIPVSADPNARQPGAKPDATNAKEAAFPAPPKEAAAPAAAKEASAPAVALPHTTATATPAAPARKRAPEAAAIESKPHEAEAKSPDKDDTASVEEQVRAALAKVDATRRPLEAAPAKVEVVLPPPAAPAVAVQPSPSTVAAVPAAAEIAAPQPVPHPMPQVSVTPPPLGAIEIKSQPVADVAATPAPPAADDAQAHAPEDKGIIATLKKIPDMLRPASGATSTPPRPPLPVGD